MRHSLSGSDNPSFAMFHFFDAKLSKYQNMVSNKASCMRKFHFLNSFPLETNFFFQFSNNDWIEQTREIKHHQIQNRSSLSNPRHPMRSLVPNLNPCPLSQRFQIRDCRFFTLSFYLQLFLSVDRMGVSPCISPCGFSSRSMDDL